jgi:hypothetical protein
MLLKERTAPTLGAVVSTHPPVQQTQSTSLANLVLLGLVGLGIAAMLPTKQEEVHPLVGHTFTTKEGERAVVTAVIQNQLPTIMPHFDKTKTTKSGCSYWLSSNPEIPSVGREVFANNRFNSSAFGKHREDLWDIANDSKTGHNIYYLDDSSDEHGAFTIILGHAGLKIHRFTVEFKEDTHSTFVKIIGKDNASYVSSNFIIELTDAMQDIVHTDLGNKFKDLNEKTRKALDARIQLIAGNLIDIIGKLELVKE